MVTVFRPRHTDAAWPGDLIMLGNISDVRRLTAKRIRQRAAPVRGHRRVLRGLRYLPHD
jgi:hypothetical protein